MLTFSCIQEMLLTILFSAVSLVACAEVTWQMVREARTGQIPGHAHFVINLAYNIRMGQFHFLYSFLQLSKFEKSKNQGAILSDYLCHWLRDCVGDPCLDRV